MKRKNAAAVALGRRGGNKRKRMSKKRRIEIARLGGLAKQAKRLSAQQQTK